MATQPNPPRNDIDEDTLRILEQRDATFDKDAAEAVDAREALKDIRGKLKQPASA